jgi:hypothetical protein
VRLDHLLSKERLALKEVQKPPPPSVGWGAHWRRHWLVGAGNGLFTSTTPSLPDLSGLGGGCGKCGCGWCGRGSILLGPERTNACVSRRGLTFWVLVPRGCPNCLLIGVCGRVVRGLGLLFENCTVDASIFVVKLPRANGGCLGTRSR